MRPAAGWEWVGLGSYAGRYATRDASSAALNVEDNDRLERQARAVGVTISRPTRRWLG